MVNIRRFIPILLVISLVLLACTLPFQFGSPAATGEEAAPAAELPAGSAEQAVADTAAPPAAATEAPAAPPAAGETQAPPAPPAAATATVTHLMTPASEAPLGKLVYDVVSKDTAPEKRAPYGDSYQINRFERPFNSEMLYNPNLDIATYSFGLDEDWVYVSIELVGFDPNDPLGINYAVELDVDHDGFGDYIVTASPPYTPKWDTVGVKVFRDTNHDTGGLSAEKSDAPLPGDGYDRLIFDNGTGDDHDLAWVRINAGRRATVQFAFKRSLAGKGFMLGVVADGGFKDVGKMDYVDRMTRAEAGSPVRDNKDYPLKGLFNLDNACRETFGFAPTGYEPQLCPRDEATPAPGPTPVTCPAPPYCVGNWYIWDPVNCICQAIIY
jgi:hypothetical protein